MFDDATDIAEEEEAADTEEPLRLDSLELNHNLRSTLENKFKIETLYPIQAQCFNPVVDGRDIVGKSRTGTGKWRQRPRLEL